MLESNLLRTTIAEIRAKAIEFRECFGDEARALTLEWAVDRFESALQVGDDEPLTLLQAATRSGYTPDHLARLIRQGKLANLGRKGAPRLRAGDIPPRRVANGHRKPYDPQTDARLLRGIRRGGISHGGT